MTGPESVAGPGTTAAVSIDLRLHLTPTRDFHSYYEIWSNLRGPNATWLLN
jgi:hypothetical protein